MLEFIDLVVRIPSSSSHTLIGGFAGAAIAHSIAVRFLGLYRS
jgi:phosphate/sulfate permease